MRLRKRKVLRSHGLDGRGCLKSHRILVRIIAHLRVF